MTSAESEFRPAYVSYPGMPGRSILKKNHSPNNVMDRKVFEEHDHHHHHHDIHGHDGVSVVQGTGSDKVAPSPENRLKKVPSTGSSIRASKSFASRKTSATTMSTMTGNTSSSRSNSSVQVAVRIRPLNGMEDDQECVHISGKSSSHHHHPSSSSFDYENDHLIRQNSSGESTITTIPGGFSESQPTDSEHGREREHDLNNSRHRRQLLETYRTVQIGREKDADSGLPLPSYTFDHVFPSYAEQRHIFDRCISPLVDSCLEGYNATVLAYGQTGSGKTHTILGNIDDACADENDDASFNGNENVDAFEDAGVIPRALKGLFYGLEEHQRSAQQEQQQRHEQTSPESQNQVPVPFEYSVKIQFLELYGEEIRDLFPSSSGSSNINDENNIMNDQHQRQMKYNRTLVKSHSYHPVRKVRGGSGRSTPMPTSFLSPPSSAAAKVYIRDGKTGEDAEVVGAQRIKVDSANEALQHMKRGLTRRVVGKTAMNAHSSRSHAIFTVVVQQTMRSLNHGVGGGDAEKVRVEMKTSKIHFVDLCGSERIKRAKTQGKRLQEGIDINKGLLVLGNVISALGSTKKDKKKVHVPYRDSKLTRLLKGSLGGNHKTLMIACISPSLSNANESTNTLRYANRAKNIKNHAKINVDPASRVVNELRSQVAALAAELLRVRSTDEDEDCPFSADFLKDLMGGTKPSDGGSLASWRPKRNKQTPLPTVIDTSSNEDEEDLKEQMEDEEEKRPLSCPEVMQRQISWNLTDNSDLASIPESVPDDDASDDGSAENPELEKDIVSYDFALSTLRQTLNASHESSKIIYTSSSDDYDSGLDAMAESPETVIDEGNLPVPRGPSPTRGLIGAPKSSLRKIRNIDELYDYLNQNTYVNGDGDIVDEDGTVVSEVVNSHVIKLDGAISQNEVLLREMTSCQELFEAMKEDNDIKLVEIEENVCRFKTEIGRLEAEMSMHKRDSKGYQQLLNSVQEKRNQILALDEEKRELQKLNKTSDDNRRNLLQLQSSITVMKRQRTNLTEIRSRPSSRGPSESDSVSAEGMIVTPDNKPRRCLHSQRTIPRNNRGNNPHGMFAEACNTDSCSDSLSIPRVRKSFDSLLEVENIPDGGEAEIKPTNSQETDINAPRTSTFDTLQLLSSWSDSEKSMPQAPELRKSTYRNKWNNTNRLETHHEQLRSDQHLGPIQPLKNERAPIRTITAPPKNVTTYNYEYPRNTTFEFQSSEPMAYRKIYEREEHLRYHSRPGHAGSSHARSVFDVVDESTTKSRKSRTSARTRVYDLGLPIPSSSSDLTEANDLCPAGFFVDTFRRIFGLSNPALRNWEV